MQLNDPQKSKRDKPRILSIFLSFNYLNFIEMKKLLAVVMTLLLIYFMCSYAIWPMFFIIPLWIIIIGMHNKEMRNAKP